MDVILIVLGVMGFGAIIISAYVFVVATRNYAADQRAPFLLKSKEPLRQTFVERSRTDRRKGSPVTFPLAVNGILIAQDRRVLPDRRACT